MKRLRNSKHLAYVASHSCCVCGVSPVEVAHVRMASAKHDKPLTGMGTKPDDKWTVPLCAYHHRLGPYGHCQHKGGERAFWEKMDIDPLELALELWESSRAR